MPRQIIGSENKHTFIVNPHLNKCLNLFFVKSYIYYTGKARYVSITTTIIETTIANKIAGWLSAADSFTAGTVLREKMARRKIMVYRSNSHIQQKML